MLLGSFHSASKNSLPAWATTANLVFGDPKDEKIVKRRGLYDKSIIECAFREDLRKRKFPDIYGGCEDFYPSLTTNGMCYTFNGKVASEVWKSSEMITNFDNLFASNSKSDKVFGGSRTVQGNQSNYTANFFLVNSYVFYE